VIVTRKRKRRSHAGRVLIPLAVLALLAALLTWPPSQRLIANGPLHPLYAAGAGAGSVIVRPLSFAGQQQTIADRNREIRDLNARLDRQRQAKTDADARAARLQQQIAAMNEPQPTPVPAPRRTAAPSSGLAVAPGAAGAGTDGSTAARGGAAAASEDEKRLAATWAAMEPEKAAAIVQRLPDAEVTRVLGAMDPDSAGAIMNALPPGAAARISRSVAQVPAAQSR